VDSRTVFRWAVAASLGVLVVALSVAAIWTLRDLLVQMLIALFIAVSLDPAVRWMIGRGIRRSQAVALIFLAVLALTVGVLWTLIPSLAHQAGALTSDFPGFIDNLRQRSPSLRNLEARFNLQPRVDTLARELPSRLGGQAVSFGRRFLGALFQVLLVLALTIYAMLDLPRLRRGFIRLFPKRQRPQVGDMVNLVVDKVGLYMIGNLVISAIAGVAALIALEALRVPFALPLAVLVAITDLIPLIGASLGAGVCVIVAAATGDLWPQAGLLLIFFVVYQQLENYLIAPRVLRNTVDIPSMAVLVAALIGGSVLGLIGALMAIPVAATVKAVAAQRLQARDDATLDEATRDEATRDEAARDETTGETQPSQDTEGAEPSAPARPATQ
jgi:predicted PurR-regulated permease PerM